MTKLPSQNNQNNNPPIIAGPAGISSISQNKSSETN